MWWVSGAVQYACLASQRTCIQQTSSTVCTVRGTWESEVGIPDKYKIMCTLIIVQSSFSMLSPRTDAHSLPDRWRSNIIYNRNILVVGGVFVMPEPVHWIKHCTSFNYGNPIFNGRNALVLTAVDLGCSAENEPVLLAYQIGFVWLSNLAYQIGFV